MSWLFAKLAPRSPVEGGAAVVEGATIRTVIVAGAQTSVVEGPAPTSVAVATATPLVTATSAAIAASTGDGIDRGLPHIHTLQ